MSVVRPELGPTLPELLRPRFRALSPAARAATVGALVFLAALVLWVLVIRDNGRRTVVVSKPVAFAFTYKSPVRRRAPHHGELVRVTARGESLAVRPLRLPPYRGDSAGFLPIHAIALEREMAARYPGFQARYETGVTIADHGYEIGFQYRERGRMMLGRRILLLPSATARAGVDVLAQSPRSAAVSRPDAVGKRDRLAATLLSFRLGTDSG